MRKFVLPLRRLFLPLAGAVLVGGCGGGGGSSPTETRQAPLAIDVTLASVTGATIVRASLHFDGGHLGTFSSSTPSNNARMDTVVQAEPGDHVIAAQIDEQTGAPAQYRLTGTIVYKGSTTDIGETSATLDTGGRIEVRIHL